MESFYKKLKKDELIREIHQLHEKMNKNIQEIDELKKEELFSEKVLDSLPGIFYMYDEDGNLIRWNKNHETFTGFNGEELKKRNMLDWFSDSDIRKYASLLDDFFEKSGRNTIEAELIVKGNKKIPYLFSAVSMTLKDENYVVGVGLDLTEMKEVEEALRKSEEKYRTIYENAVEGIFQATLDGKFESANPAMASLLGYESPEELAAAVTDIGTQLFVSADDGDRFIRLINSDRVVKGYETRLFRKDGSRIWISLHAWSAKDKTGNIMFIEGIMTDITEKMKKMEALRESEANLRKENIRLKSNIRDRYKFCGIIGKSKAMQEVYELILKAASTEANVVIYGESGAGKEMVAEAIHELSDRKDGKFVPVHCGAIPENLLESEFFGYKKGAFTGAWTDKVGHMDMAENGTLFLDELGEINPNMQVKLLRVLEGKGYVPVGSSEVRHPDVRIIAATNRNLKEQIKKGLMREDFFYRVHIIPIYIPPLRERREDIPLLVEYFMETYGKGKVYSDLSGKMMEALQKHSWPGNVRELQNIIYQYIALDKFDLAGLAGSSNPAPNELDSETFDVTGESYKEALARFEKKLIKKALDQNQWCREKTADSLGIPSRTFYRKLKKHRLIRRK